ncbi:hypothetical protein [Rheinheimera mesophila]|uniref:hypothetical protein n=1 Tax=Rheinheimera mesophila TaxID=1547515 RepID=UPI00138E35A3|nr:hypothetical protein [Rheinheimera mesophila]
MTDSIILVRADPISNKAITLPLHYFNLVAEVEFIILIMKLVALSKLNLLLKITDICASFYQILRFFEKKLLRLCNGGSTAARGD